MCSGIALVTHEIPEVLIERYQLEVRIVTRQPGAAREVRFLYRERRPFLPVWHEGQLSIAAWGRGAQARLPKTGWCRQEDLEAGPWQHLQPEEVAIPASYGYEKGVWYQIVEGVRGILVRDPQGQAHAYLLTEPASHYYRVMTRSDRMPVFIGRGI